MMVNGGDQPDRVDYLVIGGGANGMSFCDTLLRHSPSPISVVVVDNRSRPGGQWHSSYPFVRLHQPNYMYGVESIKLETHGDDNGDHRATQEEILDYYDRVCRSLEAEFDFRFLGDMSIDITQLDEISDGDGEAYNNNNQAAVPNNLPRTHRRFSLSNGRSIFARKVVDGRHLQPDLPVDDPPKLEFNPDVVRCSPVNDLHKEKDENERKYFVVIGGGKMGLDAIMFLLNESSSVSPDAVLWVVPNEAWVTAREDMGSCMDFLHDCVTLLLKEDDDGRRKEIVNSNEFFQQGFLDWERKGKVYRFDDDILPRKFNDATLSRAELALIQKVAKVVQNGQVKSIRDDGTLCFDDGTTVPLPFLSVANTLFVNCSAGAFRYSKHTIRPVFSNRLISVKDVYGTPGFCFVGSSICLVGSIIGKLESLGSKLTDAERNTMCQGPREDAAKAWLQLGPSCGDVGAISADPGYLQRLTNLRGWLGVPHVRDWLLRHRLFNRRGRTKADMDLLVEETWNALKGLDIL